MRHRFPSIDDLLTRLDPSYPVFCIFPEVLKARAAEFVAGFPGTVLYAVKCNPHQYVLRALFEAGVKDFDTASLPEIARVHEQLPTAKCYFNHPVKGTGALDSARRIYGLEDYVVDHANELEKLKRIVGSDCTAEVRLATPKGSAVYDLSAKFGATPDDGVALLRQAYAYGMRTALAFHVGSQCHDPRAFATALEIAARVAEEADVPLAYLDVGGGFPAKYQADVPPLAAYFDIIRSETKRLGLDLPLLAEPGRALVADGCSLLAQVHLRRGDALYINDGVYGCLSEIRDGDLDPPVRGIGRQRTLTGEHQPFRIFGPTCDPIDVLKVPFHLPADIQEGDWIEIGMLGAYSLALQSGFNGFITDAVVQVEGWRTVW